MWLVSSKTSNGTHVEKYTIAVPVVNALAHATKVLTSLSSRAARGGLDQTMGTFTLEFGLAELTAWLDSAEGLITDYKKQCVDSALHAIDDLANTLQSSLPRFAGIVSDTIFVKSKCLVVLKNQQTAKDNNSSVGQLAGEFHVALTKLSATYCVFSLPTKLEVYSEATVGYHGLFEEAKQTMRIMAYLKTILLMSGAKQIAEASSIKSKEYSGIPATLVTALVAIAAISPHKPAKRARCQE